jgi:hypothetical protein
MADAPHRDCHTLTGNEVRVIVHELQEPLQASRRMLGALAVISMWQQKNQARPLGPFVLAAHDEIIDDVLRNIGKVSKLCFPQNKRKV